MLDLPLGIGVFSTIIENDYLYVDKTRFIYDLYRPGAKYFLSRPRRFGKSLLISTMKELFKGNKSLFKGLYIYNKWDWNKTFTIIHLDLGNVSKNTSEILKDSLNSYLMRIAEDYQIELITNDLSGKFSELIRKIYKSTGKKVVVLVDEYDKPIIDNIKDYDLAESNRNVLTNFYGVLKSNEEFIEFIFLTGVSKLDKIFDFVELANLRFAKFSKTSIFSGLNNLEDITVDSNFSNICGYSQDELENYFENHIEKFSKDNDIACDKLLSLIKEWYNGYSWDGKNLLYNPYSILSLFKKGLFRNFWFETGTPSFLMEIIKNNSQNANVLFDSNLTISGDFPNFRLENVDFTTLLLQTGYLTIKSENIVVGELPTYELAVPNREVSESLFTYIISEFSNQNSAEINTLANRILESIVNLDNDSLQSAFDILISSVPAILYGKIKKDIREANYHLWFLSWFRLMGFFVVVENATSKGYTDLVLKKDNLVIVCELKYSENKPLKDLTLEAINQIKDKKYYAPYLDYDVLLLGIAFGDREINSHIEAFKN